MEEYIEFLRGYNRGKNPYIVRTDSSEILISYLKAEDEITEVQMDDRYSHAISGNNADGFIITEWR